MAARGNCVCIVCANIFRPFMLFMCRPPFVSSTFLFTFCKSIFGHVTRHSSFQIRVSLLLPPILLNLMKLRIDQSLCHRLRCIRKGITTRNRKERIQLNLNLFFTSSAGSDDYAQRLDFLKKDYESKVKLVLQQKKLINKLSIQQAAKKLQLISRSGRHFSLGWAVHIAKWYALRKTTTEREHLRILKLSRDEADYAIDSSLQ